MDQKLPGEVRANGMSWETGGVASCLWSGTEALDILYHSTVYPEKISVQPTNVGCNKKKK